MKQRASSVIKNMPKPTDLVSRMVMLYNLRTIPVDKLKQVAEHILLSYEDEDDKGNVVTVYEVNWEKVLFDISLDQLDHVFSHFHRVRVVNDFELSSEKNTNVVSNEGILRVVDDKIEGDDDYKNTKIIVT